MFNERLSGVTIYSLFLFLNSQHLSTDKESVPFCWIKVIQFWVYNKVMGVWNANAGEKKKQRQCYSSSGRWQTRVLFKKQWIEICALLRSIGFSRGQAISEKCMCAKSESHFNLSFIAYSSSVEIKKHGLKY